MILGQQEQSVEFDERVRAKVRQVLLKQHHHQNEKKRNNLLPIACSFADVREKQSDPHVLDKPGEGSCRALAAGEGFCRALAPLDLPWQRRSVPIALCPSS